MDKCGCSSLLLGWLRNKGSRCYWAGLGNRGVPDATRGVPDATGLVTATGGSVLLGGFGCEGAPLPKCLPRACYWAGLVVLGSESECFPWVCYWAGLVHLVPE